MDTRPLVLLTVDVEDYFISPETIAFREWDRYKDRLEVGLARLFNLFSASGARATFFWLGWEAERHPGWVRRLHEAGHEIATHTYNHDYVHTMDETTYRRSLANSLEILAGIIGTRIIGHRAPAWSIRRNCLWAVDALLDHGLRYDSSVNPYSTYLFGDAGAPRFPYPLSGTDNRKILEIPPSAVEFMGRRLPVSGGGMLRALPLIYHRWALGRYGKEGHLPMIYVHPWELDPDHPRLPLPKKQAWIHSLGHRTLEKKLRALLQRYRGVPIRDMLSRWENSSE